MFGAPDAFGQSACFFVGRFIALGLSSSCLHISPSVGGVCRVFTRSARPPALSSSSCLHFPSFCDPPCCRSRLPPHAPCRLRLCVAICLAAAPFSSSSFLLFPSFCDPPCCRSRLPPHAPCRLRLCVAICLAAALLSSSSCLHSFPPFFGIKRARSLSGPRSAFAQALIIPAYRSPPFRTARCSSARGWNATA